jgi:hypothetical protein
MFIKTILSGFLFIFGMLLNIAGCPTHQPGGNSFVGSGTLVFEDADWIKYDFSGTESYLASMCADSMDNIYLAGQAEGYGSVQPDSLPNDWHEPEYDAYLIKLDSQGNLLWNIWWDNGDLGSIYEIACDENDDVYIVGSYKQGSAFKPSQGHHKQVHAANLPLVGFLVKYDSGGNLLWTRTWTSGTFDMDTPCLEISGNGIYIAGDFSGTLVFDDSAATSITATDKSAVIAKVTPAGDIEWAQIISNDPTRILLDFDNLPDNSWCIVYWVPEQLPNIQNNSGILSPLVARLDDSLAEIWSRQFSYHNGQFIFDKDGNIYFAGRYWTNMKITSVDPSPQGPADWSGIPSVLYKFDSSGQLLWTVDGEGYDRFSSVAIDDAGNVYTCGTFSEDTDFDPGPGQAIRTPSSISATIKPSSPYVCKYDSSGNFQWVRTGSFCGVTRKIFVSPSGSLFVTGTAGNSDEPFRMFVLRTPCR